MQQLRGGAAHEQHAFHRQGKEDVPVVVAGDHRGRVRFFVVAAQLGKDLVEGHAHRDGQAQFLPNAAAQLVSDVLARAEEVLAAGHVQPALVDAEGLDLVGILGVDGVDAAAVLAVEVSGRADEGEVRAFFERLIDGFGRLDPVLFRLFVFGQDDAVPAGRVAAHRHGHVAQLGPVDAFDRGKVVVAVTVQYDPVFHPVSPRRRGSSGWKGREAPRRGGV